jgi:hypothetical protein
MTICLILFVSINDGLSHYQYAEKKKKRKEMELISLISEYYKYNTLRAKEAIKVLSAEDIEIIRKKLDKGGVK